MLHFFYRFSRLLAFWAIPAALLYGATVSLNFIDLHLITDAVSEAARGNIDLISNPQFAYSLAGTLTLTGLGLVASFYLLYVAPVQFPLWRARRRIAARWHALPEAEGIDEAARRYAAGMHYRPFKVYYKIIASFPFRGGRVLDAGCGTGTWTFALAKFFDRVDACDLLHARVQLAKGYATLFDIENIDFRQGDILKLPYEDDAFDLVFCYGVVVSYIPLATAIESFRRVLKPGGTLYMGVNGTGWIMRFRDERGSESADSMRRAKEGLYSSIIRNWPRPVREDADEIRALIATECGADFAAVFDSDLHKGVFSYPLAMRGYEPQFVEQQLSGFTEFRWAPENQLFGGPRKEMWRGELYKGRLTRWEFVATKS